MEQESREESVSQGALYILEAFVALSFDDHVRRGFQGEVYTARRIRTNTPLQALVLLNDSVYTEAARYLAFRMEAGRAEIGQPPKAEGRQRSDGEARLRSGGDPIDAVISKGYEMLMYKPLEARKLEILKALYSDAYAKFSKDADQTCEMAGGPGVHDNPETAAYVVVAEALLNLDEVITKS